MQARALGEFIVVQGSDPGCSQLLKHGRFDFTDPQSCEAIGPFGRRARLLATVHTDARRAEDAMRRAGRRPRAGIVVIPKQ